MNIHKYYEELIENDKSNILKMSFINRRTLKIRNIGKNKLLSAIDNDITTTYNDIIYDNFFVLISFKYSQDDKFGFTLNFEKPVKFITAQGKEIIGKSITIHVDDIENEY
jgi:hypothetical protein